MAHSSILGNVYSYVCAFLRTSPLLASQGISCYSQCRCFSWAFLYNCYEDSLCFGAEGTLSWNYQNPSRSSMLPLPQGASVSVSQLCYCLDSCHTYNCLAMSLAWSWLTFSISWLSSTNKFSVFCYWDSHYIAQAGPELTMHPIPSLNFWQFFCLSLLSPRFLVLCCHFWF